MKNNEHLQSGLNLYLGAIRVETEFLNELSQEDWLLTKENAATFFTLQKESNRLGEAMAGLLKSEHYVE